MSEGANVETPDTLPYKVAIGTNSKGGAQISVRVGSEIDLPGTVKRAVDAYTQAQSLLRDANVTLAGEE